jgi:hypothetical protein
MDSAGPGMTFQAVLRHARDFSTGLEVDRQCQNVVWPVSDSLHGLLSFPNEEWRELANHSKPWP